MSEKSHWIVEAIRGVPSSFLLAVFITICIVLFVPQSLAMTLGIDAFRVTYRQFLGPGLILVGSWLLTRGLSLLKSPLTTFRVKQRIRKVLSDLTPEEKVYLVPFITEKRNTIHVAMEDGVAGGLVAKGVLYRSSNVFDVVEGVPYNLQSLARKYLTAHPELLEGAEGKPARPMDKVMGPW